MVIRKRHVLLFCLHALMCLTAPSVLSSCKKQENPKDVSAMFNGKRTEATDNDDIDLSQLEENGELIAATLSGAETYYEFRGQGFGMQYELLEAFARSVGLRVRMEIAHDTTEMYHMLDEGDVDVIAYPLPHLQRYDLCALQDSSHHAGWVTRSSSPELTASINRWYNPHRIQEILDARRKIIEEFKAAARHHPRPKVLDANRGIISSYDELFRRLSRVCGWDWRLLAAQSYQESAFDPQAVSWAGAQGLMQLMPATAAQYGAAGQTFEPEANIQAAVKFLRDLNAAFLDIHNPDERINFILASYNGGKMHVLDAMALTTKYGGDPHRWADVRKYVLLLSNPKYYRDPVVRCGYLRGSETEGYVSAIRSHWSFYQSITK